jgi:hypothetical protein
MTIIPYTPTLEIVNLDQLAKGTGARYMFCLAIGPNNSLVAAKWKRVIPTTFKHYEVLIDFKPEA